MLNLVLLLAGFVPLLYGANLLVDGASAVAKKYNIPDIVIGLTIVAFGTSAPELIVNVFASLSGSSDITLGNITGSNIFNIFSILGFTAVLFPLSVKSGTTWIEIPLCFLSAAVLLVIANDMLLNDAPRSVIDRADGLVLLFFFMIFLAYNFHVSKSGGSGEEVAVRTMPLSQSLLIILIGLALLALGGRFIVYNAVRFASRLGISERVIALTIVSIGTSLPELATSIVAAKKKSVDIAIGNVVGSNLFNVFFILGISAVISPVTVGSPATIDMAMNILGSLLLFIFVFTGKGRKIERWEGITFLLLYGGYVTLLIAQ
ncbi:MAG: calcium/sodium antiporter [Pontiellaceae bacterium]|nr:calcium/sodium antiporter [Pontiellaceae bacterium]